MWLKNEFMANFTNLFNQKEIRTTNHAEGYHSTQKLHFRKDMRLGEWIYTYRNLSNLEEEGAWAVSTGVQNPRKISKNSERKTQRFTELFEV